jgi:hypothetical protein
MHPLEIEVDDMIKQSKEGKRVFPKYDRKIDETPLKYLEKYFGKYLMAFGAEKAIGMTDFNEGDNRGCA